MAGYDIGPRIGITGEKEFNNQIQRINNSLKEYGSEMKALTNEFQENENSQQALIAKSQVMEKQLEAQRSKAAILQDQYNKQVQILNDLKTAYEQAAKGAGENSKEAERAQKAFNEQANTVTRLKVAMNETDGYINNLNNSLNKNSRMLGEIEAGTRDAVTGFSNLKSESQQAADSLEDMSKGITAGNLMDAADAISGVGDKIIETGQKAAGAFTDLESVTTRVNTYFGLTGQAAEQMGGVVENVFRSGVTGSLEEVGEAVITVNNNLKNLDPSQLETITEQAINLEQVFGSDMNESMRGVNALMVNFGLDAQTAMDYIVTGTQNGLDKTQELGDNLSEYSGKFAQAGYSAEEYFQLLQNGLEGGAYNLDKVNDSINEVTTRLSDGTIADAIGQFSQETQNTFAAWQQGGATQKDVINSIVGDITNCKDQQEQLTMAATAFGTLGEDANMGVIESLTTLGDSYNNVSGAAQQMTENSTTPMQELQAAMNELQLALAPLGEKLIQLATEILPPIVEGITGLIEGFMNLPGPVQTAIGVIAGILALLTTLAPLITSIVAIIGTVGSTALLPLIGIIAAVAAAITGIITIIQNWGAITEWLGNVWTSITTAIKDTADKVFTAIGQAIDNFGRNWEDFWNEMFNFVSGILDSITQAASDAWEWLKQSVSALIQTVTDNFQKFKDSLANIWENIKNTVGSICDNIKNTVANIWNGILNTVSNIVSSIWNTITSVWNGILNTISSILNSIRNTISSIWNGIRNTLSNIVSNIRVAVVNGFINLVNGVINVINDLPQIFVDIFNNIIDLISQMISNAYSWGSDFIRGLKNGIMSGVNAIINTVRNVADSIRSFLHFSRPDEGPLRDYESWMPDMMEGLAEGIYNNIDKIKTAAKAVSGEINSTINGNVSGMVQSASIPANRTIIIQGDTMILDGEVIGKTAERRITNGQVSTQAAKGRRVNVRRV